MMVHVRRPTIGVTMQSLHAIDDIPAALPTSWVMNQRYVLALTVAGAVPWLVPLLDDDDESLRHVYERLDGILIPGGVDMDPGTYGEAPHERLGALDPPRDRVELQLTRWALEDGMPLLGLCRGLQVLNVALGGTLWQDLEAQVPGSLKHDYFPTQGFERDHLAHDVTLAPGTRLRRILERDAVAVNSMHHQGVRALAPALAPCAVSPDGLVEAAELDGEHFCIGVQWHPEVFELTDPHTRHLFREFTRAAAAFAVGRRP